MHESPSNFSSAVPVDAGPYLRHVEIRRAAAARSFWSDDPLNRAYRAHHGEVFTLRSFIAFVEAMPPQQFLDLAFQRAGGSDAR